MAWLNRYVESSGRMKWAPVPEHLLSGIWTWRSLDSLCPWRSAGYFRPDCPNPAVALHFRSGVLQPEHYRTGGEYGEKKKRPVWNVRRHAPEPLNVLRAVQTGLSELCLHRLSVKIKTEGFLMRLPVFHPVRFVPHFPLKPSRLFLGGCRREKVKNG